MKRKTKIISLVLTFVMLICTVAVSVQAYTAFLNSGKPNYGANLLAPGAALAVTDSVELGITNTTTDKTNYAVTTTTGYAGNKYLQVLSKGIGKGGAASLKEQFLFYRGSLVSSRQTTSAVKVFDIYSGVSDGNIRYLTEGHVNSTRYSYYTIGLDFFADKYVYVCTDGETEVLALGETVSEAITYAESTFASDSAKLAIAKGALEGSEGYSFTKRAAYMNSTGNYGKNDMANLVFYMYGVSDTGTKTSTTQAFKSATSNVCYTFNFEYRDGDGDGNYEWELHAYAGTDSSTKSSQKIATLPNTINLSTHLDIVFDFTSSNPQFYMFVDGDYANFTGNALIGSYKGLASYLIRLTPELAGKSAEDRIPYSMGFDNFSQNFYISEELSNTISNGSITAMTEAEADAVIASSTATPDEKKMAELRFFKGRFANVSGVKFPTALDEFIQNKEYLEKSLLTVSDALYSTTDGTDGYVVSPTGHYATVGGKNYYFHDYARSAIESHIKNGASFTINKSISGLSVPDGITSFTVNAADGAYLTLSAESAKNYKAVRHENNDGTASYTVAPFIEMAYLGYEGDAIIATGYYNPRAASNYFDDSLAVAKIRQLYGDLFDIPSSLAYSIKWYWNFDGENFVSRFEDYTPVDTSKSAALAAAHKNAPTARIIFRATIDTENKTEILPDGAIFAVTEQKTIAGTTYDVLCYINDSLNYTTKNMVPGATYLTSEDFYTSDGTPGTVNAARYTSIPLALYLMKHVDNTAHENGYYIPNHSTISLVQDLDVGYKTSYTTINEFALYLAEGKTITFDLNGNELIHTYNVDSKNSWDNYPIFVLREGSDLTLKSSKPGAKVTQIGYRQTKGSFVTGGLFSTYLSGIDGCNITVEGENITFLGGVLLNVIKNTNTSNEAKIALNLNGGAYYAVAPTKVGAHSTNKGTAFISTATLAGEGNEFEINVKDTTILVDGGYDNFAFLSVGKDNASNVNLNVENTNIICAGSVDGVTEYNYFINSTGVDGSSISVNLSKNSFIAGNASSTNNLSIKIDNTSAVGGNIYAATSSSDSYSGFKTVPVQNKELSLSHAKPIYLFKNTYVVGDKVSNAHENLQNTVLPEIVTCTNPTSKEGWNYRVNELFCKADYITSNFVFSDCYALETTVTLVYKDACGGIFKELVVPHGTVFDESLLLDRADIAKIGEEAMFLPDDSQVTSQWYLLAYGGWNTEALSIGEAITHDYTFLPDASNTYPVQNVKVKVNLDMVGRFLLNIYLPAASVIKSTDSGTTTSYTYTTYENNVNLTFVGMNTGAVINSQSMADIGLENNWLKTTIYNKSSQLTDDRNILIRFTVTHKGVDYPLECNFTLNTTDYGIAVLDTYECGSNEAALGYSILEYIYSIETLLKKKTNHSYEVKKEIETALNSHKDCECQAELATYKGLTALGENSTQHLVGYGAWGASVKYDIVIAGINVYIPTDKVDIAGNDATKVRSVKFEFYTADNNELSTYKVTYSEKSNYCGESQVTNSDGTTLDCIWFSQADPNAYTYNLRQPIKITLLNKDGETLTYSYDHDGNIATENVLAEAVGTYSIDAYALTALKFYNAEIAKGDECDEEKAERYYNDYNTTLKLHQLSVAAENYKFVNRKPIVSLKVNGNSVSEYSIAVDIDSEDFEAAKALQTGIYKATGITLPIINEYLAGEKSIVLKSFQGESSYDFIGFTVSVEDNSQLCIQYFSKMRLLDGIYAFVDEYLTKLSGRVNLIGEVFSYDTKYVYYEDFGAVGDGVTDDFEAIYDTHEYANKYGCTVKATSGKTYYIENTLIDGATKAVSAVIRTNVDWTGARFLIDDRGFENYKRDYTTKYSGYIFTVPSSNSYSLTAKNIPTGLKISKGDTNIDLGLGYPALIIPEDNSYCIFRRNGYVNRLYGEPATEAIVIDENGNVNPETPVIYDYTKVDNISVYKIDEVPLTIKGGHFTSIKPETCRWVSGTGTSYINRNLYITRSNVTVEGVTKDYVGGVKFSEYLAGEKAGIAYAAFFVTNYCSDVVIKDCVMAASTSHGHSAYVHASNFANNVIYDGCILSNFWVKYDQENDVLLTKRWNEKVLNDGFVLSTSKLPTLSDEAYNSLLAKGAPANETRSSQILWGSGGSNFCKNLKMINGTALSRFDAHQGLYNGDIIDSVVSYIALTGTGNNDNPSRFNIENSTVFSTTSGFVSLRSDYGSTWQGEISVKNSNIYYVDGLTYSVIGKTTSNWYRGYETYIPSVLIDNVRYATISTFDGKLVDGMPTVTPHDTPLTLLTSNITVYTNVAKNYKHHLQYCDVSPSIEIRDENGSEQITFPVWMKKVSNTPVYQYYTFKNADGYIDAPWDFDGDGQVGNITLTESGYINDLSVETTKYLKDNGLIKTAKRTVTTNVTIDGVVTPVEETYDYDYGLIQIPEVNEDGYSVEYEDYRELDGLYLLPLRTIVEFVGEINGKNWSMNGYQANGKTGFWGGCSFPATKLNINITHAPDFVKIINNEAGNAYIVPNTAGHGINSSDDTNDGLGFFGNTKFYYSDNDYVTGTNKGNVGSITFK